MGNMLKLRMDGKDDGGILSKTSFDREGHSQNESFNFLTESYLLHRVANSLDSSFISMMFNK
jgi:hypothetical protein